MDNSNQGRGITIQWTNDLSANVASGALVALGDQGLVGVAVQDIADGAAGSVELPPGVIVNFPVKGYDGSSNAAIAIYDKVYFESGAAFCNVKTTDLLAGYALGAITSGATTTVPVLLARA